MILALGTHLFKKTENSKTKNFSVVNQLDYVITKGMFFFTLILLTIPPYEGTNGSVIYCRQWHKRLLLIFCSFSGL